MILKEYVLQLKVNHLFSGWTKCQIVP